MKKLVIWPVIPVILFLSTGSWALPIPGPLSTAVKPIEEVRINGGAIQPLSTIVKNPIALRQLGKALFWDAAVGSDGMACASCHFQAGADSRVKNQFSPGLNHRNATPEFGPTTVVSSDLPSSLFSTTYEPLKSGVLAGPNVSPHASDFPLWSQDPLTLAFSVPDDVFSSSGTFNGLFGNTTAADDDACSDRLPGSSPAHEKDGKNLRKVEPRNTPSSVNAIFNVRNFWDGRANRVFNGNNPFGLRDANAKVWMNERVGRRLVPTQVSLAINNASLASQAVGPVLSDLEMSCQSRTFLNVAKKMIPRTILKSQKIARTDSILWPFVRFGGQANFARADVTYRSLINKAFWSTFIDGSTPGGNLVMEENFPLIFGLAVAEYEKSLISDQAKFDLIPRAPQFVAIEPGAPPVLLDQPIRDPATGVFNGLSMQESRGLDIFMGNISVLNPQVVLDPVTQLPVAAKNGRCVLCHNGPEFTTATFTALVPAPGALREFLAEPMPFAPGVAAPAVDPITGLPIFDPALDFRTYDLGFYNVGVTPDAHDLGQSGKDPWGTPLSFSQQWADAFAAGTPCPTDPVNGASCAPPVTKDIFSVNVNFVNVDGTPRVLTPLDVPPGVQGAFKTPSLRNVEYTAPYFHNGSAATLEQALTMYNGGGLFDNKDLHPEILPLGLDTQDLLDVAAFLRTLTDPRVVLEKAPFDHPELKIFDGHTEVNGVVQGSATKPANGADNVITLPAVGILGRATPVQTFESKLLP